MDDWDYEFDPVKNDQLKRERSISFEQIISLIETGNLIQILEHPDGDKYPGQWLFEINVDGYIYIVPVVRQGQTLFLKTVYPSRKATKHSRKGAPQ